MPTDSAKLPHPLQALLGQCAHRQVSDVHLEAQQGHYLVRVRHLGRLQALQQVEQHLAEQWIAALKNAAAVDITQRRIAQDGRFHLYMPQATLDCRLSVLPTLWGEKVVLRLFNQQAHSLKLEQLGLLPEQYQQAVQALQARHGLILVTGPTGSGKTHTLYAMLAYLNQPDINISTVEDPIEIPLKGINQTAVGQQGGMRFADCLRALLRQDPDVIMVGSAGRLGRAIQS